MADALEFHQLRLRAAAGHFFRGGVGEQVGSMDVNNLRLDRGLSAYDATHRFAANFVWELPFLRGRRDLLGSIAGGWQVNGIVSLQSGFPFTVTSASPG